MGRLFAVCLFAVVLTEALAAQRGAVAGRAPEVMTTATALYLYVEGDRAVVARNAPTFLPPIWNIAEDLNRLPKAASVVGSVTMAETDRAIAAFALEAARALETQDLPTVCRLIPTARNRWVAGRPRSEFSRRWRVAAIAVLLRTDCVSAIDAEVTAALADFPIEPGFRLARALVSEQQLAGQLAEGTQPSGRDLRDAETRFKIAMAMPEIAAEASLRWARINAQLGQHAQAIALTTPVLASKDTRLGYLAHLFRGWSLAAIGKFDQADDEYGAALAIVPGAQSASLARAAAAFRNRDVERAEKLVTSITSRSTPVEDPWWTYSIGDGRLVDQAIVEMRRVIR